MGSIGGIGGLRYLNALYEGKLKPERIGEYIQRWLLD